MGKDISSYIEYKNDVWLALSAGEILLERSYFLFDMLSNIENKGIPEDCSLIVFDELFITVVEDNDVDDYTSGKYIKSSEVSNRSIIRSIGKDNYITNDECYEVNYIPFSDLNALLSKFDKNEISSKLPLFIAIFECMKTLQESYETRFVYWYDGK